MRGSLKSGLSILLSGMVLGSTLLTGCKKEQVPTEQSTKSMWAKADGKQQTTPMREKKQAENKKPLVPPILYADIGKYRDTITTKQFDEDIEINLMYISQSNPREQEMDEITFTMSIHPAKGSNSELRFLPRGKYVVSSQKLEQIITLDLGSKRFNNFLGDPELATIVNKDPKTKINFDKKESETYGIDSFEEAKIKEYKKELSAEEFNAIFKHTIFLKQKRAPAMKELSVAIIADYKIKKGEQETSQIICAQIPVNPPFFPEYEGYWLDEQAKEIFQITRKEIFKTNTMYTRDRNRKVESRYFNGTAKLDGSKRIQLDPSKTEDYLEFKNNEVVYVKDKKPIKLKKIREEEAYRY